jgi:L-asparaginase II
MERYDLDVVATRGSDAIESRHRVHAAIVRVDGALVGVAGDPRMVTFWRSCAKPFQVLPLVESGGLDDLRWDDDELAMACASHGGEPEHVAIVESMLKDIALEEGDLACGVQEPLTARGVRLARETGARLSRLHNNCSGKHAAMLARAHLAGWDTTGYEHADHAVQRDVLKTVGEWTSREPATIPWGIDGCGVPVFALGLDAMALAYARLGAATTGAAARVTGAMTSRPFLIGGTDRFDTALIEASCGRVIAKVGAEGVHSVALPALGLGFALKVEDGAQRAQFPAVLRLCQHLGALPADLPPALADRLSVPVRNTRNEIVGEVRPVA